VMYTGTASSHLEFNTIVDNNAKTGTGSTGGISCGSTTLVTANNIIARNMVAGVPTATDAQTYGDCTFLTSKVQNDVTGLELENVSTVPYVLKIGPTSTAKDAATTASTVIVDFDGDERPQNGQKDIGADEYK